jgi:lysophospholipase L1-like esterase
MRIFPRLTALAFICMSHLALGELPNSLPSPGRVACVGDSITQGAGAAPGRSYPSQLQELLGSQWEVKNFGVSGRTLLRKGDFPYWNEAALKNAQDFAPNVVVIMLGTNDTKPQNWVHHTEFLSDYRDLVKIFQGLPSKPKIYICRPCPVPAPGNYGINEENLQKEIPWINQLAREMNLGLIDMHAAVPANLLPDRVHPNNEGAAVMAATVYKALTGKAAPLTAPAAKP